MTESLQKTSTIDISQGVSTYSFPMHRKKTYLENTYEIFLRI